MVADPTTGTGVALGAVEKWWKMNFLAHENKMACQHVGIFTFKTTLCRVFTGTEQHGLFTVEIEDSMLLCKFWFTYFLIILEQKGQQCCGNQGISLDYNMSKSYLLPGRMTLFAYFINKYNCIAITCRLPYLCFSNVPSYNFWLVFLRFRFFLGC